jgi:hypothetical protein
MKRTVPNLLIAIIAFVVIVSVGIGGLVWWKTAPPPPMNAMPVLLAERERLQPPNGGEDAWPRYVALFQNTLSATRWHEFDATYRGRVYEGEWDTLWELFHGDWDDPRLDPLRALYETQRPVLEAIVHATDAHACRAPIIFLPMQNQRIAGLPIDIADAPDGTQPAEVFLVHANELSGRLTNIVLIAMREAWEMGDIDLVSDLLTRALTIANHIQMHPLGHSWMLGAQSEWRTLEQVRLGVLEHDLTADQAERLREILSLKGIPISLRERLEVYGPIEADQEAAWHAAQMTLNWRRPSDWLDIVREPGARDIRNATLRFARRASTHADSPRRDRPAFLSYGHLTRAQLEYAELFVQLVRTRDRLQTQRRGVNLLLRLERHHALTGQWPAALEDIMPREDTLDPNTLTPFVYELTPDGPFPFSLAAPPEAADFLPPDQRLFTQPRRPIDEQNLSIEVAP